MRHGSIDTWRALSVAALLTISFAASAQDSGSTSQQASAAEKTVEPVDDVLFASDPQSWARVTRVVEPKYPEAALKEGRGAVVDLEVLVDVLGGVKTVRSISSMPRSPDFEAAVQEILKTWLFSVAKTDRCVPVETVGNVSITFEVRDGKGVVSLTHRKLPPPTGAKVLFGPRIKNRKEVSEDMQQSYPRSARRAGVQAQVYTLLTVEPATGQVQDIEVTHVITHPDFVRDFTEAARQGMKRTVYTAAEGRTKPWKMCTVAAYRLRGEESER